MINYEAIKACSKSMLSPEQARLFLGHPSRFREVPFQIQNLRVALQRRQVLDDGRHLRRVVFIVGTGLSSFLAVDHFAVEFVVGYLHVGCDLLDGDVEMFFDVS